jgi:hypothetical protein
MTTSKLYFCVIEDYNGAISVSSFGGSNRVEERRFARTCSKTIYLITTDHDEAQRIATRLREAIAAIAMQEKD